MLNGIPYPLGSERKELTEAAVCAYDRDMREMEFKMERAGLLKEGDRITVTEGTLPSSYYYTIDPSLAMSGNFPFSERMLARKGIVLKVEERSAGYYVTAGFE